MTENAIITLSERYLHKDEQGNPTESPEDRFWRVAYSIASEEKSADEVMKWAIEFYNLVARGEFMPNSPTIMNAGKGDLIAYNACYVLPVGDSIEEIFTTVKDTALVQKTGGGTGFSFDRLRYRRLRGSSSGSTKRSYVLLGRCLQKLPTLSSKDVL